VKKLVIRRMMTGSVRAERPGAHVRRYAGPLAAGEDLPEV